MKLDDYSSQFDGQIAAWEGIETVLATVDADSGTTEDDWSEIWTTINKGLLSGQLDESVSEIVREAATKLTFEAKTKGLTTDMLVHLRQMLSMAQSTARIMGGFGVSGIKFV